jgi:hypothetical protein
MMDETIKLMRQARSAGSLAPQSHLSETLRRMIEEAEVLKNDEAAWFYGQDSSGHVVTEAGQILGGPSER